MSEFAFNAHSGVRYLVLLVGVIAFLYANFGLARKKPVDKTGMTILRIFVGVLDLQFLLGIITVLTRPFYSALIGHLVLMTAAVAVAHLGSIQLKKQTLDNVTYARMMVAVLVPMLLIIGGILAIQRPIV